jgi:hypothetical protein
MLQCLNACIAAEGWWSIIREISEEIDMKRMVALILPMILFAICAGAQTPAAGNCDRECLRGFITQYLNAMVEHNPKALATAPNVRFTEDTVTMPLGEGPA